MDSYAIEILSDEGVAGFAANYGATIRLCSYKLNREL